MRVLGEGAEGNLVEKEGDSVVMARSREREGGKGRRMAKADRGREK